MTTKIILLSPSTPSQMVRHQILKDMNALDDVDETVTIENYRDNLLNFADVLEKNIVDMVRLNQPELKPFIQKQAMVIARLRRRFR